MKAVVFDDLLWKYLIMRDFYPCCYLAMFSILGKRVWDVLNQEHAPMIDLYSQVYAVLYCYDFRKCQRKILLMQLTKENRVIEETNDLLVFLWLQSDR